MVITSASPPDTATPAYPASRSPSVASTYQRPRAASSAQNVSADHASPPNSNGSTAATSSTSHQRIGLRTTSAVTPASRPHTLTRTGLLHVRTPQVQRVGRHQPPAVPGQRSRGEPPEGTGRRVEGTAVRPRQRIGVQMRPTPDAHRAVDPDVGRGTHLRPGDTRETRTLAPVPRPVDLPPPRVRRHDELVVA